MKNTTLNVVIFITMVAQYWLGFYMGYQYGRPDESFDYQIELNQDSIRVIDDRVLLDTTLHFDELEEFIIRDNI